MASIDGNTVLKVRYFIAHNKETILKNALPIKDKKLKELEDIIIEKTKGKNPLFPFFVDEQIVMFPVNEKAKTLCCRVTLTGVIRIENDLKNVNLVTPFSVARISLYNEQTPLSHYDMTVLDESFHDISYKTSSSCVHFKIELNVLSFGCIHGLKTIAHTCPTCGKLYICSSCHQEQMMHSIIQKKNEMNNADENEKEEMENNICLICGNMFKKEETINEACPKCEVKLLTNDSSNSLTDIHNTDEEKEPVECPICQTPIEKANELVLQCGHILHQECYKEHLRFGNHQCPLCRKVCFSRYETVMKWEAATRALIKAGVIDQCVPVRHKCHECGSSCVGKICATCGSCNTRVAKEENINSSDENKT